MIKQVFISHSSKDQSAAQEICRLLESQGIRCWIAVRDVLPGTFYAEEIIKALEGSAALLLVCTRNTSESTHVRNEVERVFSHGKLIFPVRIEDVGLGRTFEYFMGASQWFDAWKEPLNLAMVRLAESIRKVLGETDAGRPDVPVYLPSNSDEKLSEKLPLQRNPNNLPAQSSSANSF